MLGLHACVCTVAWYVTRRGSEGHQIPVRLEFTGGCKPPFGARTQTQVLCGPLVIILSICAQG